ncbi:MAG: DNA polymerase III subunit delta, partial [Bacilli bacterium]
MYLFYGTEEFSINKAITNIITNHPMGQVIKYDLEEKTISLLLEDASMISLFDDEKVIIGYNATFLSGSTKKEGIEQNTDALSSYIDHPNPNTTIILVLADRIDKRKSIVKKLMERAEVREFIPLTEDDRVKFAKEIFTNNGYQINFKALHLLIDKVGNNLYLLNSECEKLMLYLIDSKIIEETNIEEMIEKYDFDNVFALTDAVIKKDINTSLTLYQELLKRNEEPIKIIVLLANQFRLIFQVKKLYARGFTESQ